MNLNLCDGHTGKMSSIQCVKRDIVAPCRRRNVSVGDSTSDLSSEHLWVLLDEHCRLFCHILINGTDLHQLQNGARCFEMAFIPTADHNLSDRHCGDGQDCVGEQGGEQGRGFGVAAKKLDKNTCVEKSLNQLQDPSEGNLSSCRQYRLEFRHLYEGHLSTGRKPAAALGRQPGEMASNKPGRWPL